MYSAMNTAARWRFWSASRRSVAGSRYPSPEIATPSSSAQRLDATPDPAPGFSSTTAAASQAGRLGVAALASPFEGFEKNPVLGGDHGNGAGEGEIAALAPRKFLEAEWARLSHYQIDFRGPRPVNRIELSSQPEGLPGSVGIDIEAGRVEFGDQRVELRRRQDSMTTSAS